MARDAALLARAAKSGESVFSVYSWERPTLSFGRNQRARGQYDPRRLNEAQANAFAAELLMPEAWVRVQWRRLHNSRALAEELERK